MKIRSGDLEQCLLREPSVRDCGGFQERLSKNVIREHGPQECRHLGLGAVIGLETSD